LEAINQPSGPGLALASSPPARHSDALPRPALPSRDAETGDWFLSPRAVDHGVWIIVPAFNEVSRLGATLESLCGKYENVVVVDDGSEDETRQVALRYPVWVLRHTLNCGQGAALQTGIDFALRRGAEILVTFDGDGQHCADEVDRLMAPLRAGQADAVLGSRFLGETIGIPLGRRLILKGGILFTKLFSRMHVTDTHNGLRAFSREAALRIRITQNRMAHASELLDQISRLGLRYCEVPVTVRYTAHTLAKGQASSNAFKIALQMLLSRLIR
jgi:glycosyltransferase involved in cell wall biosynthesis